MPDKGPKQPHDVPIDTPQAPDASESAQAQAPSGEAAVEPLEEQLAQARQTAQEAHNSYLYAVAELQNARRRFQRELAERQQFANEQLLKGLLPVLDDFERALEASKRTDDVQSLRQGVEMILNHFLSALAQHGVSRVQAQVGDAFDPHRHEAVERVVDPEQEEGSIAEVLTPGYELHGRLLRPARVRATVKGE